MFVVLQSAFVKQYIDTGISSPLSSSSLSPISSHEVPDPVQGYFGFPSKYSHFFPLQFVSDCLLWLFQKYDPCIEIRALEERVILQRV